ncbi:MAG: TIM-barrel domain-containing protein [Terriglobia bacterium]
MIDRRKLLVYVLPILWAATFSGLCPASCRAADYPYATKIYIGRDVEVSLYSPTMFRFRISQLRPNPFPEEYEIPFVMGRLKPWPEVTYRRWAENGFDMIETSGMRIRVASDQKAFSVWTADGSKRIFPSDGAIRGMFRDGYTLFDSASAFGERNLNSRYAHWFYNFKTRRYVDTYLAGDLILDQFFIYGPGYDRLFRQLNDLVGPEPLLPKKAYGFFQTEESDCKGSQTKLMNIAKKLRDHDIPVDTLILDLQWGDGCPGEVQKYWGGLDWAPAYSQPLAPRDMLAQLHDMHFDVMLIHHNAPNFPHRAEDTPNRPGNWTQQTYDEDLWWRKIREELSIGVDGLWQDTRQNDVTDSVIWNGVQNFYGASRRVLFMGNRDAMNLNPWSRDGDHMLATASLLASRRYPFRWTGDISTTWNELRFQIDAITNSQGSMKGVSYFTADAFAKNWQHQARWNQFLAFSPVARSHTMKPWDAHLDVLTLEKIMRFNPENVADAQQLSSDPDQQVVEAWVDKNAPGTKTAENSIRKYLKLRYRLLPYIYSTAYENYLTGMPLARPLDMAFPADTDCQQNRWPYQYMFGDSFLVAPVYSDLDSMEIYLPKGSDWIDYWNHQVYAGGQIIDYDTSDAEKLPLFVRAGATIPMRADADWIQPRVADAQLFFDIYPSNQAASFALYEDDGVTTEYQSGRFARTVFEARREPDGDITLSLGESHGDYAGKAADRTLEITVNLVDKTPASVTKDGRLLANLNIVEARAGSEGWRYDGPTHAVTVKVTQRSAAASKIVIAAGH